MMIPWMLPLGQCPCPSGNFGPLILAGMAGWGLWQAARWIGDRWAGRLGPREDAGSHTPRTAVIFAGLVGSIGLVVAAGNALRSTPAVELPPTDRPRLVFLGAGRCRPCQEMAPVRESFETAYGNELIFEYHDVWETPEAGRRFEIRTIPTTIFFAPSGRELHRREGYMSEGDIVSRWASLGVALRKTRGPTPNDIEYSRLRLEFSERFRGL